MAYFLVLILIFFIVGMYFYYERKITLTRKQIMLMSKQYKNNKNDLKNSFYKNMHIEFLIPTSKKALTNNNVNIFLAPVNNSPIVNSLNIKMEVSLLDCALIDNNIWFYVSLPLDSKVNCRGWIEKKNLSIIYSSSQDLIKQY